MEEVIVIYSDSSSDSIKEIEPPKKQPPPLIDIDDVDEIILNVTENTTQSMAEILFTNEQIPEDIPENHPNHWTDDMKKFYNDDWGDEDTFIVHQMQEKMDKHPRLWQVSKRDMKAKSKKKSRMKCLNCCEFGHPMSRCKEPLKPPKCHMCGQVGHSGKRCPNSICLNCGNQMGSYVKRCNKCTVESHTECRRCSLLGHHFINCSDNWRRYHSTVGKMETDIPSQIIYKSACDVWCCNCGKRGHYEIDCKIEKPPGFPNTSPFVASYTNTFTAQGGTNSLPVMDMLQMNSTPKRKKGANHIQQNNNNDKSLNNVLQIIKRKKKKKKKKKKKGQAIDWNGLFQTPEYIPI